MASKKEEKKVVSATLATGTKVTATQEVIDKIQRKSKAAPAAK